MVEYTESDIKYEGDKYAVIFHRPCDRFEVCKRTATAMEVVGWGSLEGCIRTAKRLDDFYAARERRHEELNETSPY